MRDIIFSLLTFFLVNACAVVVVFAQKKETATFQFTSGFTYGMNDSIKYKGSISITKETLAILLIDKSSNRENQRTFKIIKVDRNKKEDLDLMKENAFNTLKLPLANEVLHIYTDDNSDWTFTFVDNRTYLLYHNNFTLTQFLISSGDYSLLASLFQHK